MRFWIARNKNNSLALYTEEPTLYYNEYYEGPYKSQTIKLDENLFLEITFENSPQEVELKLPTTKPLTRDYFSNHNWEIVIHEPDENGFILWEAKWKRSMEEGSPYYSDLTVTNMMYEDRFCISGKTSKGNVGYLMANTEEDLINILKVFAIHGFYEQESKKS